MLDIVSRFISCCLQSFQIVLLTLGCIVIKLYHVSGFDSNYEVLQWGAENFFFEYDLVPQYELYILGYFLFV